MSNLRQAAQQALEALENAYMVNSWAWVDQKQQVITALRAALAEPEQEPDGISWLKRDSGYFTAPTPRKPLTDEEIERVCAPLGAAMLSFTEVARAIEKAHGIGEQHE